MMSAAFKTGTMTLTTSIVKSLDVPMGTFPIKALLSIENDNMRYLYTGGNPSSSTGHLLIDGSTFILEGYQNIVNFRCVAAANTPLLTYTLEGQ